jgi:PAS domain S-box-containing protein
VSVLKNADGDAKGFIGVLRDITERRRAEKALKESEEKYRQLFDQTPVGIGVTDPAGNVIAVNRRMLEISGHDVEDMMTLNIAETYVDLADRERLIAELRKEGKVSDFEVPLRRKNGDVYYALLNVDPIVVEGKEARLTTIRDISQRKRAEEALRVSERKFRELFEASPAAVVVVSPAGIIVAANKATEELTGYSWEELREKQFAGLLTLAPEDLPGLKRRFEALLGGDVGEPYDLEIIRKDGTTRWIRVRNSLLWEGETLAGIQVISLDITDRKRFQEALRESEEKFRSAFDDANIGMCLVDLDGRLLQVNDQMAEIFGYSREELEGKSVNDFTHPDYLEVSPRFIERSVAGDVERAEFEKKYLHRDGHVLWGLVTSSLIRDAEGEPRYFVSHVRDVTQEKRVEKAVRESEERYRNLVETSADSIMFADLDGIVATINKPGAALLGLDDPEEVVGKDILEFVARAEDREAAAADLQRVLKEGTLMNVSYDLRRKDGSIFPSESSGSLVRDAEGKPMGFIAVTRDVSDRVRAEEALRASEGLYRTLFEKSPAAVALLDPSGVIAECNAATEELTGYAKEDIVGKRFDKVAAVQPKDRRRLRGLFEKVLAGERVEPYELEIVTKAGARRRIQAINSAFPREDGSVGIQVVAYDVTASGKPS